MRGYFGLLVSLFFAQPVLAGGGAVRPTFAIPPPAPVVDEYSLLSENERSQLGFLLKSAKANSGVEMSVYIPKSLSGQSIENFSMAVAEAWKLGRKKEDKGLLLTIAPAERKMRLEVGYGLEGQLPDAYARQILDNYLRPFFRAGRYYDGIIAGLAAIQQKVPLGIETHDLPVIGNGPEKISGMYLFWVLFCLAAFIALSVLLRIYGPKQRVWNSSTGTWIYSSSGSGGWSSGGFGSGSWGGGGGGFGGGGASSSW